MTKHRLQRGHCPKQLVKDLFMKRFRDNDWDEQDDRDATEFLDIEKSIFVEEFPMYANLFVDNEDEDEDEEEDDDENLKTSKGGGNEDIEDENNN